jgi:FixJ family two-component response regulator
MRQSGLAKRSDEREHLMLQILLLTEKEVSAVVRMNQQIAERLGLSSISKDEEIKELGRPTSVDAVAATIQESLSRE